MKAEPNEMDPREAPPSDPTRFEFQQGLSSRHIPLRGERTLSASMTTFPAARGLVCQLRSRKHGCLAIISRQGYE